MSERDGGIARTCANGCKYAEPWGVGGGHFNCKHPAVEQIKRAMWESGGWPEDDGALPENTPIPCTDTQTLGHPKDCKAFVATRQEDQS